MSSGKAPTPCYPFRSKIPLDPPGEWAELREQAPVVAVTLPSGDPARLVTRYDQARELLGDTRFSRQQPPGAARISATEDGGIFSRQSSSGLEMFTGEGHRRWRRLMSKAFTIRRVEAMRPGIRQIADNLVDAMQESGPPADIVAAIGDQLPIQVIGDLLGIPVAHRHKFRGWADTLLTLTRHSKEEADAIRYEFGAYLAQLIEEKRGAPADDLLSELIEVTDTEDGRLSLTELVISAMALLVAGHETTANMIGKMMSVLLGRPGLYAQLVNDSDAIGDAVEEVLRYDTNPSLGVPRFISKDIELGGCPVGAGSTVIISPAIANHDPRRFPDPESVDLRRPNNQHLTFGAGPHFCLGAPLARVELQVVLRTLTERMPGLRLAIDPEQLRVKQGLIVVGLEEVPVLW
jgi:cytochrome P450